jgi:phytoene dehydrogenase-like protein
MSERPDYLVVGAGHNGLVCAAHLARKGRRVLVLEAAQQVGGAAVTREFAPGHKVSAAAHLLDGLPADLAQQMDLERHGLRLAARGLPTSAVGGGAAPVVLTGASVRGVSAADAQAYEKLCARMARFAKVVSGLMDATPLRLSLDTPGERLRGLKLAWSIRSLGTRDMRELLRVGGMNAYDLLSENFDSDLLKGAIGFDATLGAEFAARSPGTVLTLLMRWAARLRAGASALAQPVGGMGAVTAAMAQSARAAGVQVRTGARVRRIVVENDRAAGVLLESGETIAAGAVVSNADPRTTFLRLLGPEYLDTDFVRRIDHFRARGLVAKLHLALDGLPAFTGLDAAALAGRVLISPSLNYLELAFNPSKYRQIPAEPALEITVPTINDPALAPAGRHVMSINVMFVPYDLGPEPAAARAQLLTNILATLERHAPGLGQRIVASELLTPADLEREFGLPGGHWHHGALTFDQFFFTRPVPGAARYATPLPGLYLCGAGSHPGGGVMGIAGRNAARTILEGAH